MGFNEEYIRIKQNVARTLAGHSSKPSDNNLPPGQREVKEMVAMPPIVDEYPVIEKNEWKLVVSGEVESVLGFDYEKFLGLPSEDFICDFHCVTRWSKLGQKFKGVPFKEIVKLVKPKAEAKYVIVKGVEGYTTNLVLGELLNNPAYIVFKKDGLDIEPKYGGPVRMVVPHLYGWKSAKHLCEIEFVKEDAPGFWEVRGYHNHADPWKEERYSWYLL